MQIASSASQKTMPITQRLGKAGALGLSKYFLHCPAQIGVRFV
jgi:hypothetical protein